MKRRIISLLLVFALAVSLLPVTAFADPVKDFGRDYQVFFDGNSWHDCIVREKSDDVEFSDLYITVEDHDGNVVDRAKYDLQVTVYKGWDVENNRPDLLELHEPFRLTDYDVYADQGYGWYGVSAVAKEGSGYQGTTRPQNFNIRHLYSFNEYCVNADFGWDYHSDERPWGDHNYFEIPSNRLREPEVWNRNGELVDPENYSVTYYRLNTEEIDGYDNMDYQDYVHDPEYLAQRYPETDENRLDCMPKDEGSYFAVIEANGELYYGKNYVDFKVLEAEPENDFKQDFEIRFDGEEWFDYIVEDINDPVSLNEIPIEVVDHEGNAVDPDKYDLTVGIETGWDDENNRPEMMELESPYRLTDYEPYADQGYGWFTVIAEARDDSGYRGSTRPRNFNIRHLYSFNEYCVNVGFDWDYHVDDNPWADREYFQIPSNRLREPEVWNRNDKRIDPEYYTITYYRLNTDEFDFDDVHDPEYLAQRYPETDENRLNDMPTENGSYFAVVEAVKLPYYGKNYVNIDVVDAEPDNDFSKGFDLRFDGEGWKSYVIENKEDTLSLDDLNITVIDRDGDEVPANAYKLVVGTSYWSDEEDREVFTEKAEPFGLTGNEEYMESGFGGFAAYAVAKDDSGYIGQTENRNFMIWHRYSFNYFGANATFGEGDEYKAEGIMSWHDRYVIPANRIEAPVVHGIAWEDAIDPAFYKLTYFVRHDEELEGVEGPDDYDEGKERRRYSEKEPLEGLPTEPGAYFARIDGSDPYYGTSYVDFDIVEPVPFRFEDAEILFDGKKEWEQDYYLDNKSDKLTLEQLNITVVMPDGEVIPADQYDLHIGVEVDYDDENHRPVIEWKQAPFGVDANPRNPESGWCMYSVYAVAKEDSGYFGETRIYEFLLRDKHTLDRDGAYIDFGKEYQMNAFRSWHYNFEIPEGMIVEPKVYNCMGDLLDASEYTLTYFERGEDVDYDDPDRDEKIYPKDNPIRKMPTVPGRYFVRLDGVEPYYGTTYADFNIVQGFATVRGDERRYYDGDTIYIPKGGEIDVCFDLYPYNGMIPAWRSDLMESFVVEYKDFDGDPYSYAHIKAGELPGGTTETLYYNWLRLEDVFDENGVPHWDTAQPVMTSSVIIAVMPDEDAYDYLLGDADGDGAITIMDVTVIQRSIANMNVNDDETLMHGDVDGDGELSILDATVIQRYIAYLRIAFEVGKPIVLDA